ncbi:hypothetical protein MPTK1_5g12360 [Marchantia polymorpha subsp. ruderalis]|uniref:Uncharacterized protein n=2 Tax=Marchantia polymorpha TaxID=3197 RepID=A0AAF6BHK7_MARPO|nr:hypothetical protein MARPO_0092s0070 [Marchantia polymorpha]BBN11491.1 hypothetical protein Mp_5g12360 [Marchantia polymorpha subsp. ruderalis]|eukprot:PTQ33109.1 hypothetical protein MARPO_0092s0070 [Marchantia polymorpha]
MVMMMDYTIQHPSCVCSGSFARPRYPTHHHRPPPRHKRSTANCGSSSNKAGLNKLVEWRLTPRATDKVSPAAAHNDLTQRPDSGLLSERFNATLLTGQGSRTGRRWPWQASSGWRLAGAGARACAGLT